MNRTSVLFLVACFELCTDHRVKQLPLASHSTLTDSALAGNPSTSAQHTAQGSRGLCDFN